MCPFLYFRKGATSRSYVENNEAAGSNSNSDTKVFFNDGKTAVRLHAGGRTEQASSYNTGKDGMIMACFSDGEDHEIDVPNAFLSAQGTIADPPPLPPPVDKKNAISKPPGAMKVKALKTMKANEAGSKKPKAVKVVKAMKAMKTMKAMKASRLARTTNRRASRLRSERDDSQPRRRYRKKLHRSQFL